MSTSKSTEECVMAASGQKQKVFHLIREVQDKAGEYQSKHCVGYSKIRSGREFQ